MIKALDPTEYLSTTIAEVNQKDTVRFRNKKRTSTIDVSKTPKPNSNYDFLQGKDSMYRSYLSLMPDGEEDEAQNQLMEERRAILEQFSKLSGREQELQRRSWTDELSNVLDEVIKYCYQF